MLVNIKCFALALVVMTTVIGGYRLLFYQGTAPSIEVMASPGDLGTEVIEIQSRLKEIGYYEGEISGVYDVMTTEAVRRFQEDKGVDASGNSNPETLYLLGLSVAPSDLVVYEKRRFLAATLDAVCPEAPYLVRVALAGVIWNRVATDGFPSNLTEVVFGDEAFASAWEYDYSTEPTAKSWRAVKDAAEGMSPCPDALYYYHTDSENPYRDHSVRYKNGKHVFLA